MRPVTARFRGWLEASNRPAAYARSTVLAVGLFLLAFAQWHLFERRQTVGPLEPTLELLVIVAAVGGVITFDFLRSSPAIYRPLIAGFALLGITGTADLMDDLVYQSLLFSVVFEHLAFVLAVGAVLVAVGRWAEERDERETELERRNERLDTFASAASHDLRNPLQVARGSLDGIRSDDDPEAVERLERALDRMETIVDDLWQFSGVGVDHLDPQPVALADVAADAWQATETGDARLVVEADCTVRADPGLLRQVLENLFRNAVEGLYTNPRSRADSGARGSATPDSSAVPEDAPEDVGDDPTVRVGPTESGFHVTADGREVGSTGDDSASGTGSGPAFPDTGFGMAIVERIAEVHGWSVSRGSDDGDGQRVDVQTR